MTDLSPPPRTRSVRRWRLIGGIVTVLAVEVLLYRSYLHGDGAFHWFTHFFAGTSAALLMMASVTSRRRRPVARPLLWLLAAHLLAMGPDLLFVREVAHRRWMDVFFGHNVSHFIPGRNLTWYVIFLGCLAVYLWAVETSRQRASARVRL